MKSNFTYNNHMSVKKISLQNLFYKNARLKYFSFIILLCLGLIISSGLNAKIRLFTFHYNRPDFLELQHKTLQKFLKEKDDYELIVFNDAVDPELKKQIELACEKLEIQCVNFPQELHNNVLTDGSLRHCQLVQYALENFGYDYDDVVGILEGDLFLIRDFSIREFLKNKDIVAAMQKADLNNSIEYIWIGLSFYDMKNIPNKRSLNFHFTWLNGFFLDSGGKTHHYLKDNPDLKIDKYYRIPISTLPREDEQQLKQLGFTASEIRFLKQMTGYRAEHTYISTEFHLDKHFLHYSWSRKDDASSIKLRACNSFLDDILNNGNI